MDKTYFSYISLQIQDFLLKYSDAAATADSIQSRQRLSFQHMYCSMLQKLPRSGSQLCYRE